MLPFRPEGSPITKCYSWRIQGVIRAEGPAVDRRQYALLATWNFDNTTRSPEYSPHGTQITVGVGNKVLLLDASTGRLVLPPFEGHNDVVISAQFSPDGACIVSSSLDRTIRVWSLESGETIVGPIQGHTGNINSVTFSPDGTFFLSGSQDETIRIWDSRNGVCVFRLLTRQYGAITQVKYSPNGDWIIACSGKGIVVWDAQNQHALKTFIPNKDDIPFHSVDISPDSMYIASGSTNNRVYVWHIESGRAVWGPFQPNGTIHEPFISVSFSPNGSYIASSSPCSNTIYVWDVHNGTSAYDPLEGHTDRITSVRFSPDSAHIVSGSYDNTLRLWGTQFMRTTAAPLPGHFGSVTSVGFSPDGTRIVSGSSDQSVCVWDVENGMLVLGPLERDHDSRDRILAAYSPDGTRIISSSPKSLVLLDAQTGDIALGPLRFSQPVISATFSSDGSRIILGTSNIVQILAADTRCGQTLMEIRPPLTNQSNWVHVTSVASSPDGVNIAIGSIHCSASVHNSRDGQLIAGPFEGHNNGPCSLAFSPNGARLVSGSFSKVSVIDVQSGKTVIGPLGGHLGWVHSVEFSPNAAHIASGARDNAVCIWDAKTGRPVLGPARWHTALVKSVRFSPGGTQVVSGSDDETIRLTNITKEFQSVRPLDFCQTPYLALMSRRT
ncbi:hypothetical protein OPQ81_005438 [Rhizoctonia solani]|nr:hypothetical protein OPQ81_005438 [Rhizoctonia solani]